MTSCAALRHLADGILADARTIGVYFGDRKVFFGSIPGVDVRDPEWCQLLDDLRRLGLLRFARADLVAAMDPSSSPGRSGAWMALRTTSWWWADSGLHGGVGIYPAPRCP
jgi:hypothetical protein